MRIPGRGRKIDGKILNFKLDKVIIIRNKGKVTLVSLCYHNSVKYSEENVTVLEFYKIPHWKPLRIKFNQYATEYVSFWHVMSYLFIFILIFETSHEAFYIKLQTELPQGHHFSQSWSGI